MHFAMDYGIKVADIGDIVNIVDKTSTQFGASAPVIHVNEYPNAGEVWYLCEFPEGTFDETAVRRIEELYPSIAGDPIDSMWFRSTQVAIVA